MTQNSAKSAKTARRAPAGASPRRSPARGGTKGSATIRCAATLLRPAKTGAATGGRTGSAGWMFLILPAAASAKLPSRSMVSVEGTLSGVLFQATLNPDGKGGHWLRVEKRLREAAGAKAGDVVTLEITPVAPGQEPEPTIPPDLRKALAADSPGAARAREIWADITPVARRDWIFWITSGKRAETRPLRIEKVCDMLAHGKRRPCCFDRSGMFAKSLSCPAREGDEPRGARRQKPRAPHK